MKKFLKITLWALATILVVVVAGAIYYGTKLFPIISGYGAKNLCSCVFVGNRSAQDVVENELSVFPLSYGSFTVDMSDSSAAGTVWGVSKRKAIYRTGFGCTLVSEVSEQEIRDQPIKSPLVKVDSVENMLWPLGEKLSNRQIPGVNYKGMEQVVTDAFSDTSTLKLRRTKAIVVVYNGEIIFEKYADGYTKDSRLQGWSMTKSLFNGLTGILVKEKKLDITAQGLMEEWQKDDRSKIAVNDLLHLSSGLAWEENYNAPSPVTEMLYKTADMGKFAAEAKLVSAPGAVFQYSSGSANILSRFIRSKLSPDEYYRFPHEAF